MILQTKEKVFQLNLTPGEIIDYCDRMAEQKIAYAHRECRDRLNNRTSEEYLFFSEDGSIAYYGPKGEVLLNPEQATAHGLSIDILRRVQKASDFGSPRFSFRRLREKNEPWVLHDGRCFERFEENNDPIDLLSKTTIIDEKVIAGLIEYERRAEEERLEEKKKDDEYLASLSEEKRREVLIWRERVRANPTW